MNSNDPISAKHPQDPAGKGGKTVRVFNARLALFTLLAVAVLAPAVYGWHHVQLQRTAKAFLERADQLEAEQELGSLRRLPASLPQPVPRRRGACESA